MTYHRFAYRLIAALLTLMMLAGCVSGSDAGSLSTADGEISSAAAPSHMTTAATTAATAAATTAAQTAQLRSLLEDSHVADIYRVSFSSVFDRVQSNGFFQESLTGRYRGEYMRSIGALACLASEVGELSAAGRALRFVTDVMQKKNLSAVPFTMSADGETVNTVDELDGRAHFVLGWALYIRQSGDTAYLEETYPLIKRETDAFCSDAYFYEQWGLMRNRRFTHTRLRGGSDYHDAFDLLTNSFVASALEQMIALAEENGYAADAALWKDTLLKLKNGIAQNLTRTVNGKTVYLELRDFDNGKGTPEYGVSWVCLSPFAAGYSGLDEDILASTVEYVREILWKTADEGGYLTVESSADGKVQNWMLGKSVGWDLAAACRAGDEEHIVDTLRFFNASHRETLYMEKMQPSGDSWRLIDCGNGEQVIWFLWGMAQVRQLAGLPARP